jgi:hypothetical protein
VEDCFRISDKCSLGHPPMAPRMFMAPAKALESRFYCENAVWIVKFAGIQTEFERR